MILVPVVERELRSQARRRETYWLRVVTAVAVVGVAATQSFASLQPAQGPKLFGAQAYVVFLAVWILVPLMTADCLSRERREGTIGLLFLAPLRPAGIVLAKILAQGLRGASVLAAALPALALPLLLGGVAGRQILLILLLLCTSFNLAMAAGMLASAWCVSWMRAVVTAMVLALAGYFGFAVVFAFGMAQFGPQGQGLLDFSLEVATALVWGGPTAWAALMEVSGTREFSVLFGGSLIGFGWSVLSLPLALALAAGSLRRGWRDKPPSAFVSLCREVFCTPVYARSLFERLERWRLERNPVGWLERRSWNTRVLAGTWVLLISVIMSMVAAQAPLHHSDWGFLPLALAGLLLGCTAFSAAGSFHRERETGLMELMLVSPLLEKQLVWGRLRALWGQFLPASVCMAGSWWYLAPVVGHEWNQWIPLFLVSFLNLPMVGLYFSLRSRHVVAAFVRTIGVGLVLPGLVAVGMSVIGAEWPLVVGRSDPLLRGFLSGYRQPPLPVFFPMAIVQTMIATWLAASTVRDLRQRRFALS